MILFHLRKKKCKNLFQKEQNDFKGNMEDIIGSSTWTDELQIYENWEILLEMK